MADEKVRQLPARTHPDERARIEALNTASAALRGAPSEKPEISYYTPLLIQCTLPHSDPNARDWKNTNGDFTLIVSSGVDKELVPYGIPYGSFPRLTLAYIITEVKATHLRRIELSASFGGFLREIGYTGNLRGSTRASNTVQNQLLRLLKSNISFERADGTTERGTSESVSLDVADAVSLWWDYTQPDQHSLWGSHIELSPRFYETILSNPVPLRTDILAALKKSPLALDVYMWISYRLYTLQRAGQEQVSLSYGRLQEQFGTGIATKNYRLFRSRFKAALADVAKFWVSPNGEKELLHYELHETGLTLFRSPLLISVPRRKIAAEDETHRILATRNFDDMTLRAARQVAGNWDVRWLANQYFEWIAKENITPKFPRAHFLDFIQAHLLRNEK